MKTRLFAALLAASAFGLTGCVTDDYGYGGVSLGYGSGYGGGGYYGDPYWGWYDDYYYPGAGYYIYDRGGNRHRWNDSQRAYWEGRRGNRPGRNDWSGFRRDGNGQGWRGRNPSEAQRQQWQQRREAWRAQQGQQQDQVQGQRPSLGQSLSDEARKQRREAWQAQRQSGQGLSDEARQQRREAWQAQRQQQQQSGAATQGWQGRPRSGGEGWGGRRQRQGQ